MWRRDRADVAVDTDAEDESRGRDGPNGYVFFFPFVLPTLLFFSLFFFLVVLFAAECSNELGGTGRNQPGRRQKRGAGRGLQGVRILLFFSLVCLLSSVLLPSLLFFFYNDLFLRGVQNIV